MIFKFVNKKKSFFLVFVFFSESTLNWYICSITDSKKTFIKNDLFKWNEHSYTIKSYLIIYVYYFYF